MYGIVVHGGVGGTSTEKQRGCRQAAQAGMEILRKKGSSLEAVVAAVKWMEDSGIFNAGVGSTLRIDGTIEMEAAIATSGGLQRTAEVFSGVKNPVLVAQELISTGLRRILGQGAYEFAMERGLDIHPGPTEEAWQRFDGLKSEVREALKRGEIPAGWTREEVSRYVCGDAAVALDTVGAVALDQIGIFALASSTGGSGLMRRGRGGDVPVRGAGFQIGSEGATVATGIGELIIDQKGADLVFGLLQMGFAAQQACQQARTRFAREDPIGFIAITKEGVGIVPGHTNMPSHQMTEE